MSKKIDISIAPRLSLPLLPILIILKLTDMIDLSWIWVIGLPFLIPLGIIALFIGVIFLFMLIAALLK